MRVRIEINGHQLYQSHEGEVLLFSGGVENFCHPDGRVVPVPVPSVTIKLDDGKIVVVNLQQQRGHVDIQVVE